VWIARVVKEFPARERCVGVGGGEIAGAREVDGMYRRLRAPGERGSEIDARVRRFLSIVLLGSITLFALHWIISWSNALGLLPVMGQPMSWLSAGVSHQILMVFPCVLAMIVALRYGRFAALALRFRMPPR